MSAALALRLQMEGFLSSTFGVDPSTFRTFEFQVDTTTLSSINYPLGTVLTYCCLIPALGYVMRNRNAPPLKWILIVHNLFLCAASLFLAIFLIATLMSIAQEKNYSYYPTIFCALNHHEQQGTLTFIYYVNHLLKYYELLDTVFLALKKKNIGFLHGYHHPATLVLTWGQLVDSTGVQWIVILLNLWVHTVMYFYYAMAALKVRMPWKRCVTIFQIVQFVADLAACYSAWAMHNWYGMCFGTNRAGIVGCFILTSYLYLFVDFYQMTYNKKKGGKGGKKGAKDLAVSAERKKKLQ